MNQIPNIEEDLAKMIDLYGKFCADPKQGNPALQAEMVMTAIHHQLQKARDESRWQTIDELQFISTELNELDWSRIKYQYEMSRHRYHSELDQDGSNTK